MMTITNIQLERIVLTCPGCGMEKNTWPGDGYSEKNQTYCCQGCAEETGCDCKDAQSREEVLEHEKPRRGRQQGGAPMPQGELTGERDAEGTIDGIDEVGAVPS